MITIIKNRAKNVTCHNKVANGKFKIKATAAKMK